MRAVLAGSLLAVLGGEMASAQEKLAPMVRVQAEYIDVPHLVMTEVMNSEDADSGPKLHARMRALVREGKARILETSILVTRNGQKALLESIREQMSPTEYEPTAGPGPAQLPRSDGSAFGIFPMPLRPPMGNAFETRNVGVTFEIEANVGAGDAIIDLRLAPEIVNYQRLETWQEHVDQWGEASIRMPVFESLRLSTGIALQDGKFGLAGVMTPSGQKGGLLTERKLMLFVKADIIPITLPEEEKE